jgi:hypothetical protein
MSTFLRQPAIRVVVNSTEMNSGANRPTTLILDAYPCE